MHILGILGLSSSSGAPDVEGRVFPHLHGVSPGDSLLPQLTKMLRGGSFLTCMGFPLGTPFSLS